MLFARGQVICGPVSYASSICAERAFQLYVVERRGSVWDTRLVGARRRREARARPTLWILLDGWVRFHAEGAPSVEAPAAAASASPPLDGPVEGTGATLSAGGEPFSALQLSVDADRWTGPIGGATTPIAASPALVDAARAVLEAADDAAALGSAASFVSRCAEAGLVRAELAGSIVAEEPAALRRTWAAIAPSYLTVSTAPTLQELADRAGVSLRQMARDLEGALATFGFSWRGLRDVSSDMRLRWAILLLSNDAIPIADVASAACYGSTAALDRALRDAGLGSPSELRRTIRASVV
ncbi:MAG TPA: AraC family transcriptional regulator [Byssovorax sp.]